MKNRLRVLFVSLPVISILTIFAVYSCKKDKTPDPVITTSAVTEITQTTATAGGNLIEIAGSSIMSKGICWSTSPDPTINDNKAVESGLLGPFTANLTQLTANTVYYVRAYAVSNAVTGYGNQVTFTTLQQAAPVISTQPVTSITSTTATSGGNLTSDGGTPVIEQGICWNTSPNPTTENFKTSDPVLPHERGSESFTSYMTGLQPNTTYYVRSYAVNNLGKTYGNELSFLTSGGIPVLTTKEIVTSGSGTVVSGGDILNDGGYFVTERGVCWNTSGNPTTNDVRTTDGSGTGSFNSNLSGLSAYTTYYVRAYSTNSQGTAYGNEISFVTGSVSSVPTLTTADVTSITSRSAISGGEIISDGGENIISRGVCWSTYEDPTASDNKTTDGAGTGSFTSTITGLTSNTTYYVRAYATNSIGTGYGSSISFTTSETSDATVNDADGNVYQTVTIGTQVWMVENLRTTRMNDNTSIPVVTDATAWGDLKTPGYSWYDNNEVANKEVYGALYNWYAVNTGKLCPAGWHVPTDAEWTELINNLGGEAEAGGKLKATGTTYWEFPNQGATNETGFSVLPGGNRWYNGSFNSIGAGAYLWSTTEHSESFAWTRFMSAYLASASREYQGKEYGQSVRCIQGAGKVLPVVTTDEISTISSSTATGGGNVSSDGGATVTVRGVCWNTSGNPKTFDNKTENGSGTGSFTSNITGLSENKTYYVRAYASNSEGTAYGNVQTFSTSTATPVVPTLSTTAISEITQTTASSGGNITSDGGVSVTARGVCWSISANPTISDPKSSDGTGTGIFISSITALIPGTVYHVRAYATNSAGTAYGNDLLFTTGAASTVPGAPTIGTATAGNAQATVTFTAPASDGGSAITSYTVTSSPGGFAGTGSASPVTLTGLTNGTSYTFTVTATNANGTGPASAASNSVTPSSTVPGAPTIGTATAGNAQATVTFTAPASDGGSAITLYTVTSNPGGITSTGTTSPVTVTGLTNGTAYTFTVTATNANGTGPASAASNSVTPSTVPGAPTIGTATAGNIQANVTFTAPASDGGSAITLYTVTSSPGNITSTGSASPITVTGLINTAYTFTVTATNVNGTGPASDASNSVTPVVSTVTNPTTGKIWMDRNLGATQVATSSTDANSYGHLYQWGRGTDGHQVRTSNTTTTLSNSNSPEHGNFIGVSTSPYDWRSPQNDNLWQGVSGTNNPCPGGFRLPTDAEWDTERLSWSTNNAAGAFASPLKLPVAGTRGYINGSFMNVGFIGEYWSSTVSSTGSRAMGVSSGDAEVGSGSRAYGFSVRCIKD